MCCHLLSVPEIDKPACVACPKLERTSPTTAHCGIHPERPDACRTFQCIWTLDPQMQLELRPDRCGVVFASDEYVDVEEFVPDEPWLYAYVDPKRSNAWTQGLPWLVIKTFLAPRPPRLPNGGSVAVHIGDRWYTFHHGHVRSGRGELEFGFARGMFRSGALPDGMPPATLDWKELMRRG